jgi:hypothetical protein
MDGACWNVSRLDGKESATLIWNPRLEHGLLCYGPYTDGWQQLEPTRETADLGVEVSSDRRFTVQDFDRLGRPSLEFSFRNEAEFPEFVEFLTTAQADKIGTSAVVKKPLSSLIEGCFLVIPNQLDEKYDLLPFNGPSLEMKFPEMMQWVDRTFRDSWMSTADAGFANLAELLDQKGLRDNLPELTALDSHDVLVDPQGRLRQPNAIGDDDPGEYGWSPCFALRLKKDVSLMWFSDFLEHASEADGLILGALHDWKQIPFLFKKIIVDVPATKRDQVAHSIELRHARLGYQQAIQQLTSMREPFKEITSLYRKRALAVDALHGASLDDIQAIQRPLPFFLDYPYRHFRKEDDHLQRIRAGQRLLGVLTKVPLYLVVEELLESGHELGSTILSQLEERPPSDGALVLFQKQVAMELGDGKENLLEMFSRLVEFMRDTQDLDAMVAARNRLHHEPYDEDGFVRIMAERAPKVIDRLRDALAGCRFLVTRFSRVLDGSKVITAEDACSADAHFRMVNLEVSLPLEQFPSDELMVWKAAPERVLKLGSLLTSTLVTRQSRDFGIFDRVEMGKRNFTFLRSD